MVYRVSDPAFVFDGVEVTRGAGDDHVHPLNDVSGTIAADRVTVVVGPSGAGKSTLLRLLNRMEEPSAGEVRFRGRPVRSYDVLELRRRVGLLMQRPTAFPGTVLDNLRAGAPALTEDEGRALLDRVGLPAEAFLHRVTDDLSGGEAQRVCLARALAVRPEVLLLDEATSALDPFAAQVVERVVRELADGGLTVVMVSHDLGQARRVADDLLVVAAGRVAATGPAADVFGGTGDPVADAYLRGVVT
jgi:putative ABC transport system ATP-binding protein